MEDRAEGKYCGSCEKVVKDFSDLSDEELIQYFKQEKRNECGRFLQSQTITTTPTGLAARLTHKAAAFLTLAFTRFLFPSELKAQQDPNIGPVDKDNQVSSKNIYSDSVIFHIKGAVYEKKSGEPLKYAAIYILVNGKPAGGSVYSDNDGKFEVNVPAKNSDDVISLRFRKRRFKTYTIRNLTPDGAELKIRMHKTFKARYGREKYIVGRYAF